MVALAGNQPANRENKLLPKFSSSVSTLPVNYYKTGLKKGEK